MIQIIENTPDNIAAFQAVGEITKEDFDDVVMPHVKEKTQKTGELNYLLKLDTNIGNFTFGAWMQDALLGLQNFTKWNRAAIVTDKEGIIRFTDMFSKVMPGKFRGFEQAEFHEAINWVATGEMPDSK